MIRTNFTKMPVLSWAFFTVFLLLTSYGESVAQAMACNNLVQVSVDPTPNVCQAIIDADMILEGDPLPNVNYSIVIKKGFIIVASGTNQVTITNSSQHFGTLLTATITNLSNNNSCWGQIKLEDKLPPVIACTNITVNCSANLNTVGIPTAVDNCDPNPVIQLTNEVVNSAGLCANGFVTITRTYIAIDAYGNISAPCNRVITVQRPTAVDFPDDRIWSCSDYATYPNITNATPYLPGNLPQTGSGIVANVVGQYCNYQVTHHNDTLQTCGTTFKIIRTWTVLDWCTGSIITTGVGGEDNIQVIKVLDEVGPTIVRAPFNVNVTHPAQHPQVCRSQGLLLPATVSDNCNSVTVKIFTPVGEAIYISGGNGNNGGFIPAPGLPIGIHNVNYVATDACGNQTTLVVPITVVDNTAPTAICDQITDVNLSSDGYATVFALTFDDGSYDNCCLDKFEVRRMTDPCNDGHDDTVFGPSVKFCCADLGAGPVTVVFRAYDCFGNFNDCMVTANVSDKIPPVLVSCPSNTRITCDKYASDLQVALQNAADGAARCAILTQAGYGEPTYYDNCGPIVTCNATVNLDLCLEGTITRTWSVKDASNNNGPNCTQTIWVDHVSDWAVEFPEDKVYECTAGVTPSQVDSLFGVPKIFNETCELVGVSYVDEIFNVVPDACYKILRTWTVINWCVVGTNIDQEVVELSEAQLWNQGVTNLADRDINGDGFFNAAEVNTNRSHRTYRDSWNNTPGKKKKPTAADNPTGNQSHSTVITDPDTDPDSDPWDGFITYQQTIKVKDTVAPKFVNGCQIPDVCITDNTCGATVVIPTPAIEDCSPAVTVTSQVRIGGVWLNGANPIANVAPGTYEVRYNATDKCNNQQDCNTTITVKDCKKPTPYCKNGLIVEIMQTGMVQLWASDFDAGSFDNCTPQSQLKLSFTSNVNTTSRTYTCDSLGQRVVRLWVTDLAGNQDFCETFVEIQDNMNACGNNPLVASVGGAIANEGNTGVNGVTVNLSGQSTGSVLTNTSGAYNFPAIPAGNDVTVTPAKDNDPLNGVTTFDLVLISKHILGIQLLDSPFKIIAADANKSNSVTTFDLVEIRKLILQIIPNFTNNTSWRFVKKGYQFQNPANPFAQQFPEVVNINDIAASVLNADFVAVKIGDVNGSAATNLISGSNDDRNATGSFVMMTEDRFVQKGEVVTVEFSAANLDVLGYQFTLNFDKNALELVELLPGLAKEENFGFTLLDKGAITASWNGDANNKSLFSVVFRATAAGQISNMVSVNSRFTTAEAYKTNGELLDVQLSFNGNVANGFSLYQNTPNPFKGETVIGFNLPEAGTAKLTVSDVSGKILTIIERDFTKGYNQVTISSNELPASGVMYYTLKTAKETATKKMVVVE